ncbi:MAG: tetratricopeptide repeat protein [Acidimicrobiia bacterium]|nr:tetratricopeptide repeat protein [Acidimicrobiia bacterium]
MVNEAAAAESSIFIVLDDYHLIESPQVHRAMEFLVEHLPATLHLVLSSRSDPPLPLARWRARSRLAELGPAALRFTTGEGAEFLRRTMGLVVRDETAAALTETTEGWAAGLQMAALALRGRADPDGFIREFTGSHRYVVDYLVEEVLAGQPPPMRQFLLQTSILERLCGPLCDAVTGGSDGAAALAALNRGAVFLEALDEGGQWYRYHRLFADLLRHFLAAEHPGMEVELHRRAGVWCREHGLSQAAVGHFMAAGDWRVAADLVDAMAEAVLSDGEFASLAAWVEALPCEEVEARPGLRALYAAALFYTGRPVEQVEGVLAEVEASGVAPEAQGTAAALRAVMAVLRGQGERSREYAQRALDLLPPERSLLRVLAGASLGLAALHDGDPSLAEGAFGEMRRAAEAAGSLVFWAMAVRRLGGVAALRGDLTEAEVLFRQIVEFAGERAGRRHPLAGLGLTGLGQVLWERNELAEAEACLREGITLSRRLGPPFVLDGLVVLSRVLAAQGDFRAAAATLGEAAMMAEEFDVTDTDDAYVATLTARLHLAEGDLVGAGRWAQGQGIDSAEPGSLSKGFYPGEAEMTTLARLFLRTHRPERALVLLERLLPRAEEQGRLGSIIELEMLRSLALDGGGAPRPAMAALARAVALAAVHGHLRVFLDEGEPLTALLRRGVGEGVLPSYAKTVLAASGSSPPRRVVPGLSDPLTERERRVLRFLAGTLTVPEMARELYVAPSTVRSHLKSIYRKLGVHRRAAAVERSRDLGLL